MKYSKIAIITASGAAILGAAGIGATALAATNTGPANYPPIVQKIANTFNLDPAKVNDVFRQQHQANEQKHDEHLKSTLDQAVKDGKITQDQEDKLIAELKTLREQFKDNKQQNRQDMKNQLEQWAKDNGINNLDQILPHPSAGTHHRMMHDNDSA